MKVTFQEVSDALARGDLQMRRPQGDYVSVRRRGKNYAQGGYDYIPVFMENEVEATISSYLLNEHFEIYRIVMREAA